LIIEAQQVIKPPIHQHIVKSLTRLCSSKNSRDLKGEK